MKVIAINSSPKMEKSKTALILNPFLEGLKEAGADVEIYYTKKLNINPCQGEFSCYFKTPGKCFQKDDMQLLLPKFEKADIWVFASPIYCDGVNGQMKILMDRMIPLLKAEYVLRNDHCRHPLWYEHENGKGKIIIVSNCGYWEMDNFDPLLIQIKAFSKNLNREFAGALLRPHGPAIKKIPDIADASKQAGIELINKGKISSEILNVISREIISREAFIKESNIRIQKALEKIK
jgi:multimeric flavodoxin WrbA